MNELFPTRTVKQTVLATLAYFDLFGVPLTRSELSEHLLWGEPDEQKIDIYLKESPLIHYQDGYFSLHGEPAFWEAWKEKQLLQRKYFHKIRRYQNLLSLCPFVKLIAVCNTLPLGDVHPQSDIDLFVIAQKNRLFLARLCLTALTTVLGVRRHGSKIRRRFCLSFYATEEHLNLEDIALQPTDLYLAYWLKTLEPLTGDYKTYEALLAANSWLRSYFPTLIHKKRHFRKVGRVALALKSLLERLLNKEKYELGTRNTQLRRIHQKSAALQNHSGTVISDTLLKFHDKDARAEILASWLDRISELQKIHRQG